MLARFSGFVMKSQMSCDESYSWSGMFLDVSFLRVKCLTVCFCWFSPFALLFLRDMFVNMFVFVFVFVFVNGVREHLNVNIVRGSPN